MSTNNYLDLKIDLLIEGIRFEQGIFERPGYNFKEQNHGLFGWDFENHIGQILPDDFILPDSTVVQFRLNTKSPYVFKKSGQKICLYRMEEKLCDLSLIKRPEFYDKRTSDGNKMVKIGQIGGVDCLFFCYQNYCSHFSRHEECLFCNLVSTSQTYQGVLKKKECESIGEVARAAWKEGMVKHVLLTGGCFSHEKEVDLVSNILESIRKHTGFERIPGTVLPSPAKGTAINRYFDAGIQAIGYSMEIWDEKLYKAICPGKSESTSHDEFLQSIRQAVNVFGAGNVYGVFVMGLEPRDSFLEGVRVLTQEGANVVPFVWSPNPGSKLEGHRAPSSVWYADTIREAAEIVVKGTLPPGTENHCYQCDGNNILHDALREKDFFETKKCDLQDLLT